MIKNESKKKLKTGYTTGTCAQAATKAAAIMLFAQKEIGEVCVVLPSGEELTLSIEDIRITNTSAGFSSVRCGVTKDSGDDPDVTDKMRIYSAVSKSKDSEIFLDGGAGIGRVTKQGLWQEIGMAAINKVPRHMILKEAKDTAEDYEYDGGLQILIEAPGGEEIAKKTFNPMLGIVGGISILGTSGIVHPMSEQALIDTIEVEIKVKRADIGPYLLAAPGNYGLDFLDDTYGIDAKDIVKCSNYIGEVIDIAKEQDVSGLLLTGHIGKFIKLAGGIMNTHSKYADCRMELFACAALEAGFAAKACDHILHCTTTEGVLSLFEEADRMILMERVMERIAYYLELRSDGMPIGAIAFSNEYGILGKTDLAEQLLEAFQRQRKKEK